MSAGGLTLELTHLVDMDLFKHRSFAVGMPLVILYYIAASGFFFTFVLFLQSGLGFSPVASGLAFAAINTGFIAASLLGPRLIPRWGNRLLSFAYALQATGLALTMLTVTSSGIRLTLNELAIPLSVFGLGAGFALSPLLGTILSGFQARTWELHRAWSRPQCRSGTLSESLSSDSSSTAFSATNSHPTHYHTSTRSN